MTKFLQLLFQGFAIGAQYALVAKARRNLQALKVKNVRIKHGDGSTELGESLEVDGILISTCTGYLCPGLTSYLSELLGLRADVLALDLVGQGCGAALPNLRTGEGLDRIIRLIEDKGGLAASFSAARTGT